jgi:hypothetical protein
MPYSSAETGYRRLHYVKADGNMHAAGGLVSSASDLANWLEVHIQSGSIGRRAVFPEEAVAETHRKQVDQDRDVSNVHRFGWGLGWDLGIIDGDTLIHRHGSFSGFRSYLSFMPEHRVGVVVLVNEGFLGSFLADKVAGYIYDRLLERPGLDEKYARVLAGLRELAADTRTYIAENTARKASRPKTLPHPLVTYTGIYENTGYGRMEWQMVDGRLEVHMGLLWSPTEVFHGERNQFRVDLTGKGEIVEFSVPKGKAKSLTYRGRTFTRIDS